MLWFPVADTFNSNSSHIAVLATSYSTLLSQLNALSKNVAIIAVIQVSNPCWLL